MSNKLCVWIFYFRQGKSIRCFSFSQPGLLLLDRIWFCIGMVLNFLREIVMYLNVSYVLKMHEEASCSRALYITFFKIETNPIPLEQFTNFVEFVPIQMVL